MLRITLNQQEYLFDKKAGTVLLNGKPVNADVVKLDRNKFHVLINHNSFNIELLNKNENAKNQTILVNGQKQTIEIYFMGESGAVYKSNSLDNLLPFSFDKNFL